MIENVLNLEGFILLVLSLSMGLIGWLCRQLFDAVKKLREDLDNLRIHIASDYVRQDRMERAMEKAIQPVLDNLSRIESSLVHKADKI